MIEQWNKITMTKLDIMYELEKEQLLFLEDVVKQLRSEEDCQQTKYVLLYTQQAITVVLRAIL